MREVNVSGWSNGKIRSEGVKEHEGEGQEGHTI